MTIKQPSVADDGYELPDFNVSARILSIPESDYEFLGRAVWAEQVKWAHEQPPYEASWLTEWEDLPKAQQQLYIRIGVRLANIGRLKYLEV